MTSSATSPDDDSVDTSTMCSSVRAVSRVGESMEGTGQFLSCHQASTLEMMSSELTRIGVRISLDAAEDCEVSSDRWTISGVATGVM